MSQVLSSSPARPGLRRFFTLWTGQWVSLLGSSLTGFALGVWVYQQTGSVTAFALTGLAESLPGILISPFAGVWVDRFSRRAMMLLCDLGSALCTLGLVLSVRGELIPWIYYPLLALSAAFSACQFLAYTAATSQLAPAQQLGRANGLVQFGQAAAEIFAPMLAGFLVPVIQVSGVICLDLLSFLIAVGLTLTVKFPPVEKSAVQAPRDFFPNLLASWAFIRRRPGLVGLLGFVAVFNLVWGFVGAMAVPLMLSFSTTETLGTLVTVAGFGMLSGGLVMSIWGGPRPRILGVIAFELLSGACFIGMGARPLVWLVGASAFFAHFTIAIINGSNKAIWQKLTPGELQGRVFGVWQTVANSTRPLAYFAAGPLADHFFEPWMAGGGMLSAGLGPWFGTGPGRGIGLMFVIMGLVKILAASGCALNPAVRHVETAAPEPVARL